MEGENKVFRNWDLLKTTKETSKAAVIKNSDDFTLSFVLCPLDVIVSHADTQKNNSVFSQTIKTASNIYHLRKVFQESINAWSTWNSTRGKCSQYLCPSVRF